MSQQLNNQAQKVLALANAAALDFNHEYVGTEHVLLGLVEDSANGVSDVLAMMGATADKIRAEMEKLVQRGSDPVAPRPLPLTPRVKQAIEHAAGEAANVGQKCVGPEHLLLGLIRESDGVAGMILRSLGLSPDDLRAEVLKIRIEQMKIVERAVRPVRASTPRKRRMREELLAHLSAIFDQELARLHNPRAALVAAAKRFGNSTELSHELQAALPAYERFSQHFEHWFGWRAPESAARYSLRQAAVTFALLAVIFPLVAGGLYLGLGWVGSVQTLARVLPAILVLTPPAHFVLMLASIKMRDAFWGAFGSRKSLTGVAFYAVVIAATATASLLGIAWAIEFDPARVKQSFAFCAIVGILVAMAAVLSNRFLGRATIRDTHWELLSL